MSPLRLSLELSFDKKFSASRLPRTLDHLRQHVLMESPSLAGSVDKIESTALGILSRYCSTIAVQWAGHNPGSIDWSCEGYRSGLAGLARACSSFASAALAELSAGRAADGAVDTLLA